MSESGRDETGEHDEQSPVADNGVLESSSAPVAEAAAEPAVAEPAAGGASADRW